MADIAELGFKVLTGGIKEGTTELDKMDRAGKRVGRTGTSSGGLVDRSFRKASLGVATTTKAGTGLTSTFGGMRKVIAGLGLVALGKNAVGMAMNFDGAMNSVQSKLLITDEAMVQLRDTAKDLGATTQFSATEAANGMGFLAQAGLDTTEILEAMPGTLNLASAANMDLASAADISTNVMGAFGLKTSDLADIVDTLAITSAKSNTSVEEMSGALIKAGPVAAQLGVDLQSVAGMTGQLANAGFKAEKAGTIMLNMFRNLVNPVGQGEKALDRLKITQSDMFDEMEDGSLKFKGMGDLMDLLKEKGVGTADTLSVFGSIAGPGMMTLLESGKISLEDLTAQLDASGVSADMAGIQMKGLPGSIKSMQSAWEGLNLAVMDDSGGSNGMIAIVDGITVALRWATNEGIDYFNKGLGFLKTAVADVGTEWTYFSNNLKNSDELPYVALRHLVDAAKNFMEWIQPAIPYVKEFGLMIVAAGVAIKGMMMVGSVFSGIAGAASLMNPITLTIAGIAAGATLLYKHWDKVSDWWSGIWTSAKSSAEGFLGWWDITEFKDKAISVATAGIDNAKEYLGKFSQWWSDLGLKERALNIKTSAIEIAKTATSKFSTWWEAQPLREKIAEIKTNTIEAITTKISSFRDTWDRLNIKEKVVSFVTSGIDRAKTVAADLATWWKTTTFKEKLMDIKTSAIDVARNAVDAIKDKWNNSEFREKAIAMGSAKVDTAITVVDDLMSKWSSFNPAIKILNVVSDTLTSALTEGGKLHTWWNKTTLREKTAGIVLTSLQTVFDWGKSLNNWWQNLELKDKKPGILESILGGIKDGFVQFLTANPVIGDFFDALKSDIKAKSIDFIKGMGQVAVDAIASIVLAIGVGTAIVSRALIEMLGKAASSITDWLVLKFTTEFPRAAEVIAAGKEIIDDLKLWWADVSIFDIEINMPSFDGIKGSLDGLGQTMKDKWAGIGSDNEEAAKKAAKKIVVGYTTVMAGMGVKEVYGSAEDLAQAVEDGLVIGMDSSNPKVARAALDLAKSGIIAPLKEGVDAHSPSRDAIKVGDDVGEGLVIGLGNSQTKVSDVAKNLSGSAISGIQEVVDMLDEEYKKMDEADPVARRYGLAFQGVQISNKDAAEEILNAKLEQYLQNDALKNGEEHANNLKLALSGYSAAQITATNELARNADAQEAATLAQEKLHSAVTDAIMDADSIKDVFSNLGDYMKTWLADKIKHFALNKITTMVGIGDGATGGINNLLGGGGSSGGESGGLSSLLGGAGQLEVGGYGASVGQMGMAVGAGVAIGGPLTEALNGDPELGSALAGVGSAIGMAMGGPLGSAAGGVIGSVVASAFGTKWEEVNSGFQVAYSTVGGSTGSNFSTEEREKSLWRGTESKTTTSALSSDTQQQVDDYFSNLNTSVIEGAKALGIEGAANILADFEVASMQFSGDSAQADFQNWLESATRDAYKISFGELGRDMQNYVHTAVDMSTSSVAEIEAVFAQLGAVAQTVLPLVQQSGLKIGESYDNAVVDTMNLVTAMGGGEEGIAELNKMLGLLTSDSDQAALSIDRAVDSVLSLTNGATGVKELDLVANALDRNATMLSSYSTSLDGSGSSGLTALAQIDAFTDGIDKTTGKVDVNLASMLVYKTSLDNAGTAGIKASQELDGLTGALGINLEAVISNKDALIAEILATDATNEAGAKRIAKLTAELDGVIALEAEQTRLTASLTTFSDAAKLLGMQFDPLAPSAVNAADAIVTLVGGVDQFNTATNKFLVNYYSEAERTQMALKNQTTDMVDFNTELISAGLATVSTKDEFKNLVEGLDASNPIHQKIYASAMLAQDSMHELATAQDIAAASAQSAADIQGEAVVVATANHAKAQEAVIAAGEAIETAFVAVQAKALVAGESFVTFAEDARVLGIDMSAASPAAISAASSIVELTGGMDKFTAASANYYDNFYTETERNLIQLAQQAQEVSGFNDQLAAAGLQTVATKGEFRSMMEGMDEFNPVHQKLIASALGVQDSFVAVADSGKTTGDIMNELPDNLTSALTTMDEDVAKNAASMVESSIAANDEQLQGAIQYEQQMLALEQEANELKMQEISAFHTLTEQLTILANETMLQNQRIKDEALLASQIASNDAVISAVDSANGQVVQLYDAAGNKIVSSATLAGNGLDTLGGKIVGLVATAESAAQRATTAAQAMADARASGETDLAVIQALRLESVSANQESAQASSDVAQAQITALKESGVAHNVAVGMIRQNLSMAESQSAEQTRINNLSANDFARENEWRSNDDGFDLINQTNGAHATGFDYVPFDGYTARLHRGEGILNKEENAERLNTRNSGKKNFMPQRESGNDDRALKAIEQQLIGLRSDNEKLSNNNTNLMKIIADSSIKNTQVLSANGKIADRASRRG